MATAKKLPSGSWRVQVYAGKDASGKLQYRSFTRPTKKEAEYEALQWQLHYKEVSRDSTAMTLAEAMSKYIANKDGILSPSTIRGYDIIRREHLKGLMDIRLNRLTPALIQEAINQETKPYTDRHGKTKTPSPKSVRNVHGLLSAVLAEYCPGLRLNTTLPQKQITEQSILEPEEIAALLHAVEGTEMEIPVLLAVWLCMRSSEITGLTWDCIDFQRGTVTIRQARVRNAQNEWVEKNSTKTTIAIFKKANNKRKRQTNAGNPAAKQNRVPYEPRQGAGPDFGPSIHEGGPSSWTTSSQWDSDRDCRAEGTELSSPFPPGPPGQPLHGESAYCPSQQCLRA